MTGQFVGYHIDNYTGEGSPVSTGATQADALGKAAQRVLLIGALDGEIGVKEADNITAAEFAQLGDIIDTFFANKGIAL